MHNTLRIAFKANFNLAHYIQKQRFITSILFSFYNKQIAAHIAVLMI